MEVSVTYLHVGVYIHVHVVGHSFTVHAKTPYTYMHKKLKPTNGIET